MKQRDFENDFDECLDEWMVELKGSMKELKESLKDMVLDLKDTMNELKYDLKEIFDSSEISEEMESIF